MHPRLLLLKLDDLPEWRKDNPDILWGFRASPRSSDRKTLLWVDAFWSLFQVHNETINIWSHLVGVPLFTALASTHVHSSLEVFLPLLPFFVGAVTCFALSAVYHASFGVSESALRFFSKLDYLGIAAVVWGASVSMAVILCRCEPTVCVAFVSVSSLASVAVGVLVLDSRFAVPAYRLYRCIAFAVQLSALGFPFAHTWLVHTDTEVQRERFSKVGYYTQLMLVNIAVAVVLFSYRIPERFISNTFDFVGNSHHFLHIFSLLAIYCFYLALAEAASTLPPCEGVII